MSAFCIRSAVGSDLEDLICLATSLSARGFLTLPSKKIELEELIAISQRSFSGELSHPDGGRYLFVLEDELKKKVIGCSLIIARHGTPESPHLFFQVDSQKKTLKLRWEAEGRTELGGLILDQGYRGYPEKLGKRLSYVRLLYIGNHPTLFRQNLLAELLPPFNEGKSALWEAVGRRFTGLDYREADQRSRHDKSFVAEKFPKDEIPISSLPPEARAIIGQTGPETAPVARMLEEVGFRYLYQVDPFDGGPHYGARLDEIRQDLVREFLTSGEGVKLELS